MKRITTLILLLFSMALAAQINTLNFEEFKAKQSEKSRKSILLIHTNWCIYCHQMLKEFKQTNEITNYINENYNVVLLDAETKKNIEFEGKNYVYIPNSSISGIHELAFKLGEINGELSFPTLIIMNEKNEIIYKMNSYLDILEIYKTLKSGE